MVTQTIQYYWFHISKKLDYFIFLYLLPQRKDFIRYFINFHEKLFVQVGFFLVLVISILYNFFILPFSRIEFTLFLSPRYIIFNLTPLLANNLMNLTLSLGSIIKWFSVRS